MRKFNPLALVKAFWKPVNKSVKTVKKSKQATKKASKSTLAKAAKLKQQARAARKANVLKGMAVGLSILFYGTLFTYSGYTDLFANRAAAASTTPVATTPAPVPAKTTITSTLTPAQAASKQAQGFGAKRVAIALQEYREGVVEASHNCNCGERISLYTQNNPQQWCTDFISWVTMQAGDPVWSDKNQSWRINNSRDLTDYLKHHGTWYGKKEVKAKHIKPQPGDFIVTYRGKLSDNLGHVSLVVGPGTKKGTVNAVDANIQGTIVYTTNYDYTHYAGFLGFGRP